MKVLVLTAFYPIPNITHERMFVHVRNLYYQQHDIDVTVLNFNVENGYDVDGIKVISKHEFDSLRDDIHFDVAVSHSANLRNHYRFLKKYNSYFPKLVFFFHGHEVLYMNHDYPKPYDYMVPGKIRILMQDTYDWLKIHLWAQYYKKLSPKAEFIFVSKWLLQHFKKNSGLSEENLQNHIHIINNSVGKYFEENHYDCSSQKLYDFITIRSNIDGAKYCIDLVTKIAQQNPGKSFLLIGKGHFFEHFQQPANLTWINKTVSHKEIISCLNKSRYGLMPTRQDTQGVMTCEMLTFGIPTITSDIEVCHEFFESKELVQLIPNDVSALNLSEICSAFPENHKPTIVTDFYSSNTIKKEVDLLKSLTGNDNL